MKLELQVASHAAEMFRVLCDPVLYEHENEPPPSPQWLRARYERLESRRSPDGTQQWLNWVIRLDSGELAGYVQATVYDGDRAAIAYVLASRHWGRGIASRAVATMMGMLKREHGVRHFHAVLKAGNARSLRLLKRLGFMPAPEAYGVDIEPGELLMVLPAAASP